MIKNILLSIIGLLLLGPVLIAQNYTTCGSIMTKETVPNRKAIPYEKVGQLKSTFEIPLQIHIIRRSDGSGGLDEAALAQAMVEVDQYYSNAGVSFVMCQAINYIDDDNHYYFNDLNEDEFCETNEVLQQINLYFAGNVTKDGNAICGYGNFPGEWGQFNRTSNRVFVKNLCANSQVIAHELGHCLELIHTHDDVLLGAELVNGSNCATKGDRCCDTPADPGLNSGVVNPNTCWYTGSATDSLGDSYTPSTRNIMSYAHWDCQDTLTPDQLGWVTNTLQTKKSHLACDGVYMTEYNCADWDEPNNQAIDAWNYFLNPNDEINIDYVCLPKNDVDWYEITIAGARRHIKVIGVNDGFGAYTLSLKRDSNIITIETLERNMLGNDTKIFLYDENMVLLTEDDNSGIGTYSKIEYDLDAPTPIKEISKLDGIQVFPNPVENILNITSTQHLTKGKLSLYNSIGQLVYSNELAIEGLSIDLSNLTTGIYVLHISSKEGSFTQKVVK